MALNQFYVMPLLFVLLHLAALILSLVYWRRCPSACALLLPASIMNLAAALGRICLPFLLQHAEAAFLNAFMLGLTALNWLGYALMLMAIFAGRNEPTRLPPRLSRPHEEDDDWHAPAPKPPTPPSTGIQASG